jgi:ribonuclease D
VELVKWREERVKQLNLPRKWVADDTVLLDLAHVRPKDMEHLGAFRGLNKGELKNSGTLILKAIERAMSLNQQEAVAPPKYDKPEMPTPDEGQALELLKCYVGILADKHRRFC